MKWGIRGNCRFGGYHDMVHITDTKKYKIERCRICNKRFKWNKWNKGRIDNIEYLKAHVRQFAQPNGATKRPYHKLYKQDKLKIEI